MAGSQEMLSKIRSLHEYSRISTQVILLSGGISREISGRISKVIAYLGK